jgi:hypothetical protein
MAAVSQGAARKKSSDLAVRAYMHASILAVTDLSTINPDRLRLALNYSTFLFDTAEETDQACFIAKRATDDAQAEVESLETDVHPESIRLIELLRKRNVSRLLVSLFYRLFSLITPLVRTNGPRLGKLILALTMIDLHIFLLVRMCCADSLALVKCRTLELKNTSCLLVILNHTSGRVEKRWKRSSQ